MEIKEIDDDVWEIPLGYVEGMRDPGRIYASQKLFNRLEKDAIKQTANVATLPGIQRYSIAMPEAHVGYGFPIGGVAGIDAEEGVISPGGVGFDINCGVRLLSTHIPADEIRPKIGALLDEIFREVPSGVGSKGKLRLNEKNLKEVFQGGARWAVENGYGFKEDLDHCEENGFMKDADPSKVSKKAYKRGMPQLGTLGSGNHFLEIGYVEEVFDPRSAEIFGLERGEVSVLIHTGSRGAGHQICTDSLQILEGSSKKYGINVPDRQLACAPVGTEEAEDYYGAMCTAANYAWANRQIITHWIRVAFKNILKVEEEDLKLVYDVAHNIAKVEEHEVEGKRKKLYVHRKGATRAFPPESKDIPDGYKGVGQPVFIPGSMGTYSYVLKGTKIAMKETFGTTCHGAGRVIARGRAKRTYTGRKVREELKKMGITVRVAKDSILAEEAPQVYKSSDDIVEVVDRVGISKKVARLKPLGVVKG